jgi:hypothetical protein
MAYRNFEEYDFELVLALIVANVQCNALNMLNINK